MLENAKCFPGGSAVKNPPSKAGDEVWSLGGEDPLTKGMATHSSSLPGQKSLEGYSPWGCKRVGHELATKKGNNRDRKGEEGGTVYQVWPGIQPIGFLQLGFQSNGRACRQRAAWCFTKRSSRAHWQPPNLSEPIPATRDPDGKGWISWTLAPNCLPQCKVHIASLRLAISAESIPKGTQQDTTKLTASKRNFIIYRRLLFRCSLNAWCEDSFPGKYPFQKKRIIIALWHLLHLHKTNQSAHIVLCSEYDDKYKKKE